MPKLQRPFVSLFLLAPLGAALAAQDGIRIVRVPEHLQLPAAGGSNLLLEVELTESPDSIWLASDEAAQDRVPLQRTDARHYQQNLADPRLFDLLPAGRDQGSLFVFAKFGQRTVQSTAIAWTRSTVDDGRIRCLVRRTGAPTLTVTPEAPIWIDATQVLRIELQGAGARQSAAVARLEDLELPLTRRAQDRLWVLENDAALQERLRAIPGFEIELRLGATSELFRFRCVPAKLERTDAAIDFVVLQRKRAFVPGSRDWLEVRLDDITMGHVLLEMVAADGTVVLTGQLVQDRDYLEFALADERYVLVVQKLHNLLIGDDYADLTVQPAAGFRPDPIGQLLHAVAASGDTFVREGQEYPGPAAAQFLLAKLGSLRGPPPTLEEFVEHFASRSSTTGNDYTVRDRTGRTMPMRDWLRAALREIEAAEAARGRDK